MSNEEKQPQENSLVKKATLPTSPEERDEALAKIWNDANTIRQYFADGLSRKDFAIFVGKGRLLGANPFTEEIYPAKFGGKMQIIVSRDFYRRKAQEQEDYDGHRAMAIYSNDEFSMVNGEPKHEVTSFADRGKLAGAYAMGWRKGIENHFFVSVKFSEYNQGNYMWKQKPETMIKKVAEAHLLRQMYEGILGNTYTPGELGNDNLTQEEKDEAIPAEAVIFDEDE